MYLFHFCVLLYLLQFTCAFNNIKLCGTTDQTRSCTTQILGQNDTDNNKCKVEYFPSNSVLCKAMNFGPIANNAQIGGVRLKPHILPLERRDNTTIYYVNYTVLNITFTNIKWKTMKFRFQLANQKNVENHCRNIVISNDVKINDQSVLYYDCFWSLTDRNYTGQSHILDFEATNDRVINRGQYYFNIPSAQMLSTTITERDWKPFIYLEILPQIIKLHILAPPDHLKIPKYQIQMKKECSPEMKCDPEERNSTVELRSGQEEAIYEHSLLRNPGSYHWVVTPLHAQCGEGRARCAAVRTPAVTVTSEAQPPLGVCVASVAALVVAALFAHYVALRLLRRFCCSRYVRARDFDIPPPTKILVVYSTANRVHAECVASFVKFLRAEYGFDVLFDGDVAATAHGDPYVWAEQAFRDATHVLYAVGPADAAPPGVCDRPIVSAHRDLDLLLLALLRASRRRRAVANIFFDHSTGAVPPETRHDKAFFLLKDWQKMIAHLSQNMLPTKIIMRSDQGRYFLDELSKAKKLLNDGQDVLYKHKTSYLEKKVLL